MLCVVIENLFEWKLWIVLAINSIIAHLLRMQNSSMNCMRGREKLKE
jgi:hypothetical protein